MTRIQSFDKTEAIEAQLLRPDRFRRLFADLAKPNVIARGAGLSYCNAGAVADGRIVLSALFNRFLAFDIEQKVTRVESGVTMSDLFEFAVAHGLMPPVLPGYPTITVGGALAMNVHGKNQHRSGNFGSHVRRLTLYHPRHGVLNCSPDDNSELFHLTIGGFGLTGFLLSADIALEPLRGRSMIVECHKVGNLYEAVEFMESMADRSDYLYSWHDLNRTGKQFGRGTVYQECFSQGEQSLRIERTRPSTIRPLRWPTFGRMSIPLMCQYFDFVESLKPRRRAIDLYRATFPIVGKEIYFRLFGQRGFREYQVLLPRERWTEALEQVVAAVKSSGAPIALASFKLFRGERRFLNFSGDGICLALNTPNTPNGSRLFSRLDDIAINYGGIGNIAKDSRLDSLTVKRMYGEYGAFRKSLRTYDPDAHFRSELRNRLDV